MTYDENVFKEKANRKARKIWIIFAILLSANYGADTNNDGILEVSPVTDIELGLKTYSHSGN